MIAYLGELCERTGEPTGALVARPQRLDVGLLHLHLEQPWRAAVVKSGDGQVVGFCERLMLGFVRRHVALELVVAAHADAAHGQLDLAQGALEPFGSPCAVPLDKKNNSQSE